MQKEMDMSVKKAASKDGVDRSIDYWVSIPAILIVLGFAGALFTNPEGMNIFMTDTFHFMNQNFGWMLLVFEFSCVGLCLYFAFGKYANKRFGDEKPDGSTFSFYAMLFAYSSSASIVYWVFIEFYYYISGPPFGITPFSEEAVKWSMAYPVFHWGILGFSSYAIIGIALAFLLFVKKKDTSRVSAACESLIGAKRANGKLGKVIDCVFLVGIIFSNAGYSLAVSVPIVGTFFSKVFGVKHTLSLDVLILLVVVICMAIAMYTGLKKGMTLISNARLFMFFGVAFFIFLVGNTSQYCNNIVASTALWIQNFIPMSLNTSQWSQSWTIFYALFFIASVLGGGQFYSKLCKGRTVRQCVLGIVLASSAGCAIFFWTMGNFALDTYLGDPAQYKALVDQDAYSAITYVIDQLPFSNLIMIILLFYAFVSAWTFIQSAVYGNALVSQPNLPANEDPSKFTRLFWCVVTCILSIGFLYIGGIQTVKNAMVWAGYPAFVISLLIIGAFFRDIKTYWGDDTE
ncbi:L-carnitine/gamma-butyrobetaine antiporter [Desulfuromusa kysingii]|uniref:L-carnitine/gamma-butyrobetaine antiporter n=1 Tax=Desulfuromusa kysingii TaxID=37625 RepID=A0A1H4C7N8_9BACT|nr:BCCT family transporter [Desulfuromusa kysingii]SEA56404.1 L-carnitine/gamma-butyrobetaine antiporter [Desulfuromusa kysingii]